MMIGPGRGFVNGKGGSGFTAPLSGQVLLIPSGVDKCLRQVGLLVDEVIHINRFAF